MEYNNYNAHRELVDDIKKGDMPKNNEFAEHALFLIDSVLKKQ